MSVASWARGVRWYFARRPVDRGLKPGQWVWAYGWPNPVRIVAINDHLGAAAVRIVEGLEEGKAIVVWPIWHLRRLPAEGA